MDQQHLEILRCMIMLAYRRNSTASPETSFFLLTNALHPVVRRCLRGWPVSHSVRCGCISNQDTLNFLWLSFACLESDQTSRQKRCLSKWIMQLPFLPSDSTRKGIESIWWNTRKQIKGVLIILKTHFRSVYNHMQWSCKSSDELSKRSIGQTQVQIQVQDEKRQ